jgi:hypothetical protein
MHVVATPIEPAIEHPLVLVTWRDAFFDFERDLDADERADYLVHTVGFLLDRGPRFVSLAQEVLPDGEGFRAVTHVPVSVVEHIQHLVASGVQEE